MGCSTKTIESGSFIEKMKYLKVQVPEEYLVCESLEVNTTKIVTQADVSRLLIDMYDKHSTCVINMNNLKEILKKQ